MNTDNTDILKDPKALDFFIELARIIKAGEFIPPRSAPIVRKGIEPLGKMNIWEKSLVTMIACCKKEQEELLAGAWVNWRPCSEKGISKKRKISDTLSRKKKGAEYLLSKSINRFLEKRSERNIIVLLHSNFTITAQLTPETDDQS